MKRSAVLLSILTLCFYLSCTGKNSNDVPDMTVNSDSYFSQADTSGNSTRQLANNAAIQAAFALDFRPLKAEPVSEAETLSAAELSGSSSGSSGQGSSIGGGLRKLADYKTVYFDSAKEAARIQEIRAAQEAGKKGQIQISGDGPLTVIDWGPRGEYSSAIQRP